MPDKAQTLSYEIGALARLRDTEAVDVILSRLDELVTGAVKTIPLNEINWSEKAAHGHGYADGLTDFRKFLMSRLGGHVDDEGTPTLGKIT